jgi:L-amino acid N-acyltransferase YncA
MADLSIRPAAAADLSAITAIYAEAVANGTGSFEIEPPSEAEMGQRYKDLIDGGFPYFVAVSSGLVLGYGYAGPYRLRPAYRHTVEDSIYLASDARGRGIGSALLGALVTESAARNFRQMIAVIGDSRNIASIRLHQAAGFALVGTFRDVGHKHGRWLDCVLMQRALGPGSTTDPQQL